MANTGGKTKLQIARELNWYKYIIKGIETKVFCFIGFSLPISGRTLALFEKAFASLRADIRSAERGAGIVSRTDW